MLDTILFGVFPYVAIVLAVVVSIRRFSSDKYSITTKSSQFLENQALFYGSIAWHYAILIILAAHLIAIFFPGIFGNLIADPLRLQIIEITGFGLGLLALFGIVVLILRRLTNPRIKAVTGKWDKVVGLLLLLQVLSGVFIAMHYRWGAAWFIHTASPWIWSLLKFAPNVDFISNLPHTVKFHFFNTFLLIALLPFTKLIHVLTFPIQYLIRPPQVVVWNRSKTKKMKQGDL